MLSLYQRLILGCALLLLIVLGITLFVRGSLRRIAATDAMLSSSDGASARLAGVASALAR